MITSEDSITHIDIYYCVLFLRAYEPQTDVVFCAAVHREQTKKSEAFC